MRKDLFNLKFHGKYEKNSLEVCEHVWYFLFVHLILIYYDT